MANPTNVAKPVKPTNPMARAHRFRLLVGNGWRRVTVTAPQYSRRTNRPRQSPSIWWSRYQGSEVMT